LVLLTPSIPRGLNKALKARFLESAGLFKTGLVAASLFAVLIPLGSPARKAPSAKAFEQIDGCVVEPDEWTDGDSFRVRLPDNRLVIFRLYYVDTTESRSRGKRSDEQAAYFGITREQAIELGQQAKEFTARALEKPFTIYTRWRAVFGPSRWYAIALTSDGRDLNELLVSAGLARIYGTRTALPDGPDSRTYLVHLTELETEAKAAKRGGWGMVKP
jgi:endonuclease YncB( thermonuclease family)